MQYIAKYKTKQKKQKVFLIKVKRIKSNKKMTVCVAF